MLHIATLKSIVPHQPHQPSSSQPTTQRDRAASLGIDPIGPLLLNYSLPAIIGMTASSLYNVIDRGFISNGVGPLAIAGLALTMPLMNLTAAFGSMIGAGASTMVSIRLGQGRREDATHILGNTFILNFIIGLSITILGLIFLKPLLYAFGASEDTIPYATDFMQIILVANLFNHNFIGLNNVMRSSGYPKKAMLSSLLTVFVNLCLAPLFIFVFHWGIRGAALATAIAQLSGFIWVMYHFVDKSSYIHFQSGSYKLKKRIIQDILSIGMSPFLMNLCASVIAIIINRSLAHYGGEQGDLAIGAYGIVNSLVLLFTMIVFGLNMGMQPIAGYNYGAKKNERVRRLYQLVLIAATIILSLGCCIGLLFTKPIISLFTPSGVLHDLSVKATRIIILSFPIVGFQIVTSSLFQSIGKAKLAILLSLSRQLIFLIPTLFLLPRFMGLDGVWAAIPVSDTLACIMTFFVLMNHWKKLFPKSPVQQENA